MGDMADYYTDHSLYEYDEFMNNEWIYIESLNRIYKEGKLKWKTKEGKEILIQDMSDSHIANSIKYLKKNHSSEYMKQVCKILIEELSKR